MKTEIEKLPEENPFLLILEGIFNFLFDLFKTILMVFVIAFLIRFYLVQPFYVSGSSMEPTFKNGEYLLIDEITYKFREPERGEVIVFKFPQDPKENYIKRIIGLPNEKVEIKEGEIIIYNSCYPKGIKLKENYLPPGTKTPGSLPPPLEGHYLKENQFIVLGDNRSNSSDSRVWGAVHKKNIIGKVWISLRFKWKKLKIGNFVISFPTIEKWSKFRKPIYNLFFFLFSQDKFYWNSF